MSKTLGKHIAVLSRQASRFYGRALKAYGVSAAEYPILFLLTKQEGLCLEAISKDLCLDKAAVTRIIQGLQKKNFVEIELCQQDHRRKLVYLSQEGKQLKKLIVSLKKQWEKHLCRHMDEQETKLFQSLLEKALSSTQEVL